MLQVVNSNKESKEGGSGVLGVGPGPAGRPTAGGGSGGADRAVNMAPEVLRAILEGGHVKPARLWILLQTLDPGGRGSVGLDQAEGLASGPDDVAAGAGLFWSIDPVKRRLYLRSQAKVFNAMRASNRRPARRFRARHGVPVSLREIAAGPEVAAVAMRRAIEAVPA